MGYIKGKIKYLIIQILRGKYNGNNIRFREIKERL